MDLFIIARIEKLQNSYTSQLNKLKKNSTTNKSASNQSAMRGGTFETTYNHAKNCFIGGNCRIKKKKV